MAANNKENDEKTLNFSDEEDVQTFLKDKGIDVKLTKPKVMGSLARKLFNTEKELSDAHHELTGVRIELAGANLDLNITKTTLDDTEKEFNQLKIVKTDLETELCNTKDLLLEATTTNDQLSSKIVDGATAAEMVVKQKKILSLMGGMEKDVYVHLEKKGALWKKIDSIESITRLEEVCGDPQLMSQLSGYHCILVCLGARDIEELETNCLQLAQRYIKCVNRMSEILESSIIIMKLPPARLTLNLSDVMVFNGALRPADNIKVIECPDLKLVIRSKIYNMDGGLTEYAAKAIANIINSNISIPDDADTPVSPDIVEARMNELLKVNLKPTTSGGAASGSGAAVKSEPPIPPLKDDEFGDFILVDNLKWGLVIGKLGSNLNRIQATTNTSVKMVYSDPLSGAQVSGAFIRGHTLAEVQSARQLIKNKLDAEKRKIETSTGVSPVPKKEKKI